MFQILQDRVDDLRASPVVIPNVARVTRCRLKALFMSSLLLASRSHNGGEVRNEAVNLGFPERFDPCYDPLVITLDIIDIWKGIL